MIDADIKLVQQKYQNLFEHVPSDIIIINKDYQIVETNQRSKELFGAIEGAYCYEALKNRSNRCQDCTARTHWCGYIVWKCASEGLSARIACSGQPSL